MKLRTQLLLVSLLTLALPWAGCQYVREMERAQRQGVEDGLLANATIVASALAARPELIYPYLEIRTAARDPDADVYATRVDGATVLDGYADNWVERAGLATEVMFAPGISDGTYTEVVDGALVVGDRVITEQREAR